MKLQYAILADSAEILPSGKFVIMGGGVEYINAPSFPAMNPSLALVVRLTVGPQEVGREHQFRVELLTPDGTRVAPTQGNSAFTPTIPTTSAIVVPLNYMFVVNFPGLVFPMAGKYEFRLFVDEHNVGNVPILLQTLPSTNAASA